MSTHHYYKERLGFDPAEARANGTRDGKNTGADFKTFGGYEESLSKFKGIVYTLNIYQLIGRRDPSRACPVWCVVPWTSPPEPALI